MMARQRGFIMIAVLVVAGIAILIVTSLLFVIQSEVAAASGISETSQSRALAQSGVQVVMTKLQEQRDRLLEGEKPQLDTEYAIFETDTRMGVARLLPVGPAGEHLVAEGGKLDINLADADQIEATGIVDAALAQAIVQYRDETLGRRFESRAELLAVPGMTPDLVYGPIEEIRPTDDADFGNASVADRLERRFASDEARGLADVITVYGFEPALQRSGRLRINLNTEWSDELASRIEDQFGSEGVSLLQQLFENGESFEKESRLVELLRFFQVEHEEWLDPVDRLTSDANEFHRGRIDLNSAPYEALLALPGVTSEQAAEIVRMRDSVGSDTRWSIVWPLIEGVLTEEQYPELAGLLTTRCWVWRVRIAAGVVDFEDDSSQLRHPVIYDAVIDLAGERPRIAYLRDMTLWQTATNIAANAALDDPASDRLRSDDGDGDDASANEAATLPESEQGGFDDMNDTEDPGLDDSDGDPAQDVPPDDDGLQDEPVEDPGGTAGPEGDASESGGDGSGVQRVGRWTSGG